MTSPNENFAKEKNDLSKQQEFVLKTIEERSALLHAFIKDLLK